MRADQPRHPVHRPQLVEHRAADARHAVGLELHAARQVEGVDGVHQAEDAGRDQVVQLDAFGQPRPDPLAVVLHQRQVHLDQPVAQLLVGQVLLELDPELLDIFRSDSGCHAILRDGASPTLVRSWLGVHSRDVDHPQDSSAQPGNELADGADASPARALPRGPGLLLRPSARRSSRSRIPAGRSQEGPATRPSAIASSGCAWSAP